MFFLASRENLAGALPKAVGALLKVVGALPKAVGTWPKAVGALSFCAVRHGFS